MRLVPFRGEFGKKKRFRVKEVDSVNVVESEPVHKIYFRKPKNYECSTTVSKLEKVPQKSTYQKSTFQKASQNACFKTPEHSPPRPKPDNKNKP